MNVVLQIAGHKTWLLFPPGWLTILAPYPKLHLRHRQSQLHLQELFKLTHDQQLSLKECKDDLGSPNGQGFNQTSALEVYRVDMRPGDVLYVPPFWSHEVTAADASTNTGSLSLNLFAESSSSAAIDDAYGVRLPLQPVCLKIHRRTFLSRSVCAFYLGVFARALVLSFVEKMGPATNRTGCCDLFRRACTHT
jgi:hypothetical protein